MSPLFRHRGQRRTDRQTDRIGYSRKLDIHIIHIHIIHINIIYIHTIHTHTYTFVPPITMRPAKQPRLSKPAEIMSQNTNLPIPIVIPYYQGILPTGKSLVTICPPYHDGCQPAKNMSQNSNLNLTPFLPSFLRSVQNWIFCHCQKACQGKLKSLRKLKTDTFPQNNFYAPLSHAVERVW